jgi:hypothetical protein
MSSSVAELTVVGWLGSYGGEDSTSDISRGKPVNKSIFYLYSRDIGLWAGTVGTQRLLKLFKKYDIKATWFIPGKIPPRKSESTTTSSSNSQATLSKPFLRTALPSAMPATKLASTATRTKTPSI